MRWAPPAALLLSVAALVLHLPGMGRRDSVDALVRQGVYIPLLRAEAALEGNDGDGAVRYFAEAALRARLANRPSDFRRVWTRLGSAGKDLARRNPEEGWKLLQRFVLWSGKFDVVSARVETWVLDQGLARDGRFLYTLYDGASGRTAWGERTSVAPLALLRRLPPGFDLGRLEGQMYGESPSTIPGRRFARIYPFYTHLGTVGEGVCIVVRSHPLGRGTLHPSANYRFRWDLSIPVRGGEGRQKADFRYCLILDRIALTDDLPSDPLEAIWLERTYARI